ncbi:MAG: hypothetical protein H7X89_02255 [Rhizobiales bacterium]|nr:hypothetical protein [Hyphomicrobiales bacterium]
MATLFRILIFAGVLAAATDIALAVEKDQSRLPATDQVPVTEPLKLPDPDADARPPVEDLTAKDPEPPADESGISPDDMSLGEIPEIKTIELTLDIARHAIDSYVLVKTKYAGTDLESSDNLQEFVDKNPQGKDFEADVKAAGFANVDDWNTAITTLGFAYTGFTDDPTVEIKEQIGEIEADTALAQDLKTRMISSLNAMIPSANNRTVVAELIKDPAYAEKLKQLETVEE